MNPGTSEMQFVAARDRLPAMRGVLCLFEGVCSGAADGYARMSGRPASTLLHPGPGLANAFDGTPRERRVLFPRQPGGRIVLPAAGQNVCAVPDNHVDRRGKRQDVHHDNRVACRQQGEQSPQAPLAPQFVTGLIEHEVSEGSRSALQAFLQ